MQKELLLRRRLLRVGVLGQLRSVSQEFQLPLTIHG